MKKDQQGISLSSFSSVFTHFVNRLLKISSDLSDKQSKQEGKIKMGLKTTEERRSTQSDTTSSSSEDLDIKHMAMDPGVYLDQLGQFGRFQLMIYLLTAIPALIAGAVALQNVFVMGVPKHRCFIPNCDSFDSPDFSNETCSTFSTGFDTLGNACYYNYSTFLPKDPKDVSDSSTCEHYVFGSKDFTSTVTTEVSDSRCVHEYKCVKNRFFLHLLLSVESGL